MFVALKILGLVIAAVASQRNCEDFSRDLVGVTFIPFVKGAESSVLISYSSGYDIRNIETMLEIVLTKFSKVMTISVNAQNVPYKSGTTYSFNSAVSARIAEVAARINRQRKTRVLTVLIGIQHITGMGSIQWESEVRVAVEAAKYANFIYPGTVEGIQFSEPKFNINETNFTLSWLKKLRKMTGKMGLKIGTHQSCGYFTKDNATLEKDPHLSEMVKVVHEIVKESDFIICMAILVDRYLKKGVMYSFSALSVVLLEERQKIKEIKPEIEVMFRTLLPGNKQSPWNNPKDLRVYWEEVNDFAIDANFSVWLGNAFDVPQMPHYPTTGWWKLLSNNLINNFSGYIEKISGKPVQILTEEMRAAYKQQYYSKLKTGIMAGGLGLLIILLGFQIIINKYRRSTFKILSARDITEFKFGLPYIPQSEENGWNVLAFKQPFDTSYEIPQENLEILWDEILGGGEFGFVCKAILRCNNEEEFVALKMARPERIISALKGILCEIKILIYLGKHPNIVTICGAYTSELEQGIAYIVTELCPHGNLNDHLRNLSKPVTTRIPTRHIIDREEESSFCDAPQRSAVSLADLARWSHEIACGMEYLETKNVVHADLATRNVLLSSDRIAKIADFGLSKRLSEYSNYKKKKGRQEPKPWRWMALESLTRLEFSVKSDVWSYGVTLWEIFSLGDLPFPERFWDGDFIKALEGGLRLSQPANATDEMYQLMLSCWTLSPMHRTSFSELRAKTEVMLASEEEKNEVQDIYSLE